MPGRYDEQLPPELEPIAARLREERPEPDPLALDRLKRRLMTKNNAHVGRLTFMKARLATILTVVGIAGGTGGALAIASHTDHHAPGGAASGQYCNKKGHGHGHGKCKGHHKHHGHCSKKGGDHGKCKGHEHPGHCSKKGRDHGKCKGHHKHHGDKRHHPSTGPGKRH